MSYPKVCCMVNCFRPVLSVHKFPTADSNEQIEAWRGATVQNLPIFKIGQGPFVTSISKANIF